MSQPISRSDPTGRCMSQLGRALQAGPSPDPTGARRSLGRSFGSPATKDLSRSILKQEGRSAHYLISLRQASSLFSLRRQAQVWAESEYHHADLACCAFPRCGKAAPPGKARDGSVMVNKLESRSARLIVALLIVALPVIFPRRGRNLNAKTIVDFVRKSPKSRSCCGSLRKR